MFRRNNLPAVFRSGRIERRMQALEDREEANARTLCAAVNDLARAVSNQALAIEFLGKAMQMQSEALPGEHPLNVSNAGRGGH